MEPDTEDGILHGGGMYSPVTRHHFAQGRMRNGHTAVCFVLTETKPGDGSFACIPGSNTSNYPPPGSRVGSGVHGNHYGTSTSDRLSSFDTVRFITVVAAAI